MQRRADGIEPRMCDRAIDHGLMCETAARAAIFLRHAGAQQPGLPEFVPGRTLHDAVLRPLLDMRDELAREEAARLLFQQHEVLGHPGGTRYLKGVHWRSFLPSPLEGEGG